MDVLNLRIINDAEILRGFYLHTRYPNQYYPPTVPGEKFDSNKAKLAFDAATRIYEHMSKMIEDETQL